MKEYYNVKMSAITYTLDTTKLHKLYNDELSSCDSEDHEQLHLIQNKYNEALKLKNKYIYSKEFRDLINYAWWMEYAFITICTCCKESRTPIDDDNEHDMCDYKLYVEYERLNKK